MKVFRRTESLIFVAILAILPIPLHAQVLIDFETAGQFSGNFRTLIGSAGMSQTSNGAGNDYVNVTANTGSTVYDANGATAGLTTFSVSQSNPLTVSANVRFDVAGNSFGFYFVNPAAENVAYLALFNVNILSGNNDQIRFASDANAVTGGAGSLNDGNFANNADVGIAPNSVFNAISATYSINGGNNPVLSLTAGTQTSSFTFGSITTPLTSVEVGFRFFSGGNIGMDQVSIVPEPSVDALLGFGFAGMLLARRFRRMG